MLFIGRGIVGILYYGSLFRGGKPAAALARSPLAAPSARRRAPAAAMLGKLFAFFLKAGA